MSSTMMHRFFDIRIKIHTSVSQVQANKIQCERLATRIDQLIDPVESLEHASSSFLRQETRSLVDKFLQCVDDCNDYMEKLKSPTQWEQDIREHPNEPDQFEELNQRLSQLGQDLCLALNIQQLFDREQDRTDKKQDLQDLNQKINQLWEQQQHQYKLIDKIIHQRLESFNDYLLQKLSIQQDSNQARSILAGHENILRIPYKNLFIEENPIGNGGFADVYKGKWLTNDDQVAVKILRTQNLSEIRPDFYQEISIMHRTRYEHILTMLGVCIEPNFYSIVVEYMSLGSLYDILHRRNDNDQTIKFSWSDRYSLAWQMSKSINYLHNCDPCILHRDIKSKNFLIKPNESSNRRFLLKLCDFGLAENQRQSLLESTSSQIVGSLPWKAPELLSFCEKHTQQSDVYSLGITMWELASAQKPWDEHENDEEILARVKAGERPKIPLNVPENYTQVIEDAWNHDPFKRPTCFDLIKRIDQQIREIEDEDQIIPCLQTVISTTDTDSTKLSLPVMESERHSTDKSETMKLATFQTESHPSDEQQEQTTIVNTSSTAIRKKWSNRSVISKIITPSDNAYHLVNRHKSIIKLDDSDAIVTTTF